MTSAVTSLGPLPELVPTTSWFWTAGADGVLRIQGRGDCGQLVHPPAPVCPRCRGTAMAPRPVSGKATVVGCTVNHQPWHPAFPPPHVVEVVALDDDPTAHLTTSVVDSPVDEVHIGQRVAVRFDHVDDVWLPVDAPTGEPDGRDPLGEPVLEQPRPAPGPRRFGQQVMLSGGRPGRHGGQVAEGRTHGLGFLREAVQQLRREAGDRRVAGAEVAVVTSGAGTPSGVLLPARGCHDRPESEPVR